MCLLHIALYSEMKSDIYFKSLDFDYDVSLNKVVKKTAQILFVEHVYGLQSGLLGEIEAFKI